ncbi:MAG: hypothetical protein H6773_02075 [Pseudomonadales bacterium]|nr:hypothetical protein [Candidatus Woesebacteria bacterium]MCB9800944.1 hypothetical protein [Pseudomonadales bacterium]
MRKLYWYITAYIKKHGLVVIGSVVGAIVFFSFTIPGLVSQLEKNSYQYVGVVGEYNLTQLPPSIANQLSAGLTKVAEDGSTEPALAERWTVENEGITYRFVIKNDIFWQDGKKLTPEDVSYNLTNVETVVTPNDIVFRLPDPYAPFPTVVTAPLFRLGEEKYHFFFTRPTLIGIGKNKVVDYSTTGSATSPLRELVVDSPNKRTIYRFFPTEEAAITAFKHGKIDQIADLNNQYDVFDWNTVSVTEKLNTKHYLAIFFNIREPIFDKNIRQALSYALEKPDDDVRAIGPISRDSWAYFSGGKRYDKDIERATERLLDSIPPFPLEINVTTTALYENEAESIKEQWEAFGAHAYDQCRESDAIEDKAECEKLKIAVNISITNFPDLSSFQVLLIGQEVGADPDQYPLWHSEEPNNFTGYTAPRIDKLLEEGRQTFNIQERKEKYQEFQQFFIEDAPAIFLRYLKQYSIERK